MLNSINLDDKSYEDILAGGDFPDSPLFGRVDQL